MTPADFALALFAMAIWGCNYAFAKLGLLELPPFALVSLRFLLVGLATAPFASTPRRHLARLASFSAVFGTMHFGLVYLGLTRVDAATGAALVQLQVPFAAILSAASLRERPGRRWAAGVGLAFAGALVLLGEPRLSANLGFALLIVLAAAAWAVSYLQLKRMQAAGPIGPFSINAWTSLFTAPQLAALSLALERDQLAKLAAMSALGWASLAYQVVFVGVVAYVIWYRLVGRYPVNVTSPFTLTIPVFSALAGAGLLREPVTGPFVVGALLTASGVAVVMVSSHRRAAGAAPAGEGSAA
ncbi:MAG TPA: EamA family transporter [Polyangiaceae bacterium]|nr:EamA family transporter [Polyangiaceae bacterium]